MADAHATTADASHQFASLVSELGTLQERESIVRVGNELSHFSAALTDVQLDGLAAADIRTLVSMVGHVPPPREYFATDALGNLGRHAAEALPMLQRLSWESPDFVCEPDEAICIRTGTPDFVAYMIAFEDIRTDMVAHGQRLPDALEYGNDVRIRQSIERVLAERDPAKAHTMMVKLARRATLLPGSAMARLEDSTINSLAALLEAEPDIRFEAATILGHAHARAARAIPALERAMRSSVGVPTKWHRDNAHDPISGDDYIQTIIDKISTRR